MTTEGLCGEWEVSEKALWRVAGLRAPFGVTNMARV